MKANKGEIARVVAKGGEGWRALLFYGPDESTSRTLADGVGKALPDATRIDLGGPALKADPARLADEAASASLFGGRSWIRIDGAGEEILPAVQALLDLPVAENPVVIVAGALRKSSKLLSLLDASPAALTHASYVPEGRNADEVVFELARAEGLEVRGDLARALHEANGGDRALIASELAKFALFLDAAPGRPQLLDAEVVAALAEGNEAELDALTEAVLDGDRSRAITQAERLASTGVEGITVSRALLRSLLPLARMRAAVDAGSGVDAVLQAERVAQFNRQARLRRQLGRWRARSAARAVERLVEAELGAMAPGGLGPLAVTAALTEIAP